MIQTKVIRLGPDSTISIAGTDQAIPVRTVTIFGKSTQNGTPSPESPVAIVSVGDSGDVTLTGVYEDETTTWVVTVANGLKGIIYQQASPQRYLVTQDGQYLTTQDGTKLMAM